jgi:hypothetical protein
MATYWFQWPAQPDRSSGSNEAEKSLPHSPEGGAGPLADLMRILRLPATAVPAVGAVSLIHTAVAMATAASTAAAAVQTHGHRCSGLGVIEHRAACAERLPAAVARTHTVGTCKLGAEVAGLECVFECHTSMTPVVSHVHNSAAAATTGVTHIHAVAAAKSRGYRASRGAAATAAAECRGEGRGEGRAGGRGGGQGSRACTIGSGGVARDCATQHRGIIKQRIVGLGSTGRGDTLPAAVHGVPSDRDEAMATVAARIARPTQDCCRRIYFLWVLSPTRRDSRSNWNHRIRRSEATAACESTELRISTCVEKTRVRAKLTQSTLKEFCPFVNT